MANAFFRFNGSEANARAYEAELRRQHTSEIINPVNPRRNLTGEEELFIMSRGGFIALEMIEDTVKTLVGKELEEYLNSESGR